MAVLEARPCSIRVLPARSWTGGTVNSAFLLDARLPRGEMWLDLTDEKTLALLHLLTETAIHPYPDPPRRPAQSGGVRHGWGSSVIAEIAKNLPAAPLPRWSA